MHSLKTAVDKCVCEGKLKNVGVRYTLIPEVGFSHCPEKRISNANCPRQKNIPLNIPKAGMFIIYTIGVDA